MRSWFRRYLESMLEDDWSEVMSPRKKKPAQLPLLRRLYDRRLPPAEPDPVDLARLAKKKFEIGR